MEAQGSESARLVHVLYADPDLGLGLPAADLAFVARLLVVPELRLAAGPWTPEGPHERATLLVLSGLVTRDVSVAGRAATTVFGPGDVLEPWPVVESFIPEAVTWSAPLATTLAVLDARFLTAMRRWPSLAAVLRARRADQEHRAAVHRAIAQLPRVEDRVLALLWLFADRWGQVGAEGVILPLRFTHEALGRLIGARRSTVTLALGGLDREGAVRRREDGALALDARAVQRFGHRIAVVPEPIRTLEPLRPALRPAAAAVVRRQAAALHAEWTAERDSRRQGRERQRRRTTVLVDASRAASAAALDRRRGAEALRAVPGERGQGAVVPGS